jgi:hypothetical protein
MRKDVKKYCRIYEHRTSNVQLPTSNNVFYRSKANEPPTVEPLNGEPLNPEPFYLESYFLSIPKS